MFNNEHSEKEILLRCEHLEKKFFSENGIVWANSDINLNVYKGETVGIVGESGCGKSTLARLIMQLEKPTGGEIYFRDEKLSELKGEKARNMRKNIQMVFQDPLAAFNPKMKIEDIITEPLLNFKCITKKEKKHVAAELLRMVNLPEEMAGRFPNNMSGGQRQRVAIARAVSLKPELIVCDEATSALDVSIQESIMELLVKLQKEKDISIVFICHDLALVQAIAHRVVVMYLGNAVEIVEGEKLTENAAHPYTKALLESVFPLSFEKYVELKELEGEPPSPVNLPAGCPFQSRCIHCMDICRREKPNMKTIDGEHSVACHLY
ncbi:MAG: ABC transporter ATP-binding protein [Anaerovoracaceae bacterium]